MTDPFNPKTFPLQDAAREGKNLLLKELTRTDPSGILAKDDDGRTPLFWAASSSNVEGLSILLKAIEDSPSLKNKFDIEDTDGAGWTLLHVVSSVGSLAALDLLINSKFSSDLDANAQTSAGQTPLHYAVSKNHIDVVRRLLTELKASARIKDVRGQLPLHRAAAVGSLPLTKLLIEQANSPINATDKSGWTPLHHALAEGNGDVGAYLVEAGADVDLQDSDGKTALQVAYDKKTADFVKAKINAGTK